jgi:hypothetical protein
LQNVLTLRPKDSHAHQLVKDLEVEEQEYLHLRHEKTQVYQSALNAWKNGDVSEALSHMRLVLELDGRAPDILSPETGASYQTFYNQVRSEHDAINNAYAEARRRLADNDFARALDICKTFLAKYPGQALFQALKFDVEEQQRQQVSAAIADVNRRLEAESDLNAKVSLLREAVETYPGEPHFEHSLKLVTDKRDLEFDLPGVSGSQVRNRATAQTSRTAESGDGKGQLGQADRSSSRSGQLRTHARIG